MSDNNVIDFRHGSDGTATKDATASFRHNGSHHGFADGETWKTGSSSKEQRQAAYLQWLLTPEDEREPATKTELAEFLGVTIQTLGTYTRDPRFQRQYAREAAKLRRVEKAEKVLDRLYERAMSDTDSPSASNTAAKIWLDHTLKPLEGDEVSVDLSDLSNEEVQEKVIQWVAKQQAQ